MFLVILETFNALFYRGSYKKTNSQLFIPTMAAFSVYPCKTTTIRVLWITSNWQSMASRWMIESIYRINTIRKCFSSFKWSILNRVHPPPSSVFCLFIWLIQQVNSDWRSTGMILHSTPLSLSLFIYACMDPGIGPPIHPPIHLSICLSVYIFVHVHGCGCADQSDPISFSLSIYLSACVRACVRACVCVCICMCICICLY